MSSAERHGARLSFLAQFLIALFRVKSVNLAEIATGFVGPTQAGSHYKRLQRFFRNFTLDSVSFAQAVVMLMAFPQPWVLCFDRTQWTFGELSRGAVWRASPQHFDAGDCS